MNTLKKCCMSLPVPKRQLRRRWIPANTTMTLKTAALAEMAVDCYRTKGSTWHMHMTLPSSKTWLACPMVRWSQRLCSLSSMRTSAAPPSNTASEKAKRRQHRTRAGSPSTCLTGFDNRRRARWTSHTDRVRSSRRRTRSLKTMFGKPWCCPLHRQ